MCMGPCSFQDEWLEKSDEAVEWMRKRGDKIREGPDGIRFCLYRYLTIVILKESQRRIKLPECWRNRINERFPSVLKTGETITTIILQDIERAVPAPVPVTLTQHQAGEPIVVIEVVEALPTNPEISEPIVADSEPASKKQRQD